MPLVFNQFDNTPPNPAATYYAHVLTAIPIGTEASVSALILANPAGYAPITATISTVAAGSATNWSVADITWLPLTWDTNLVGTAIVLQVGPTRDPAVDRPFLFYEFENGLRAPIVLTPGYFGLKFSAGSGFIFTTQAATKYDSGNFIGFPLYKDLLTLLASNNGTRYTPGGPLSTLQYFSTDSGGNFLNLTPNCYWLGHRPMLRELQNRHDIGYNNITFPNLPAPVLGLTAAATFNGVDSYVTLGNTTLLGGDFSANSINDNTRLTLLFYFYPTLNNTEEILVDTTTSSTSGGYVIRKTAANKIEFLFITAGTPHTAVSMISLVNIDINAWNFVMFGGRSDTRNLHVNATELNLVGVATNWATPTLTNGIRIGARRGLNTSFTGANFNGQFLYYKNAIGFRVNGSNMPILANRNSQLPYNPGYATGWSQTGLDTATEMITPNTFEANKNTFLKSVGNLNTYIGANNIAGGAQLNALSINLPDCFYVNFGRNKVKVGQIALVFPSSTTLNVMNYLLGVGSAPTSAILSVWATNVLPNNTPTNANLLNPALWDKYDLTINNLAIVSGKTSIASLPVVASGAYRFHLVNTNITKYYKYYRIGWKNIANAVGGDMISHSHYLFFNSSVLSAELDLIPPVVGYAA